MSRDRSLDEFAVDEGGDQDGESGAAADDPPDPEPDGAGGAPTDAGPGDVGPATPTYGWRPEGGTCDECGEPTAHRWRAEGEDGGLVCAECKEW